MRERFPNLGSQIALHVVSLKFGLGGFEVKCGLENKFNGPRTTKDFQVICCQGYVYILIFHTYQF